jgi:hypothetical protein
LTNCCIVCMKKVSKTRWFYHKCCVPHHSGMCGIKYYTLKQCFCFLSVAVKFSFTCVHDFRKKNTF